MNAPDLHTHTHEVHANNEPFDYNQITDHIYLGTNQCCTVGINKVLQKEGITVDISLEEDRLDQPFGITAYLWLPTPDNGAPTQDQIDTGVAILNQAVSHNQKVYVHCRNGHGRAPTLVAAYLTTTGLSPDRAIEKIASRRESIHPNKEQHQAIEQFRKRHRLDE